MAVAVTKTLVLPGWLSALSSAIQCATCVMLIMYFLGKLQCDVFVRASVWANLALAALGLAWLLGSGDWKDLRQ
jgi:hypothetical protein